MNFDKSKLMDIVPSTYIYKRGEAYATDGRVRLSVNACETGIRTIMADVTGSNGNENRVTVRVDDNTSEILNYSCTCPYYIEKDGGCKHIAAAVLAAYAAAASAPAPEEDIQQEEKAKEPAIPDAKSDMSVSLLIRSYANVDEYEETAENGVDIQPVIQQDYDDVTIGFKIGTEKMYIIKDLKKFRQNMQDSETVEYGKSFTFTHTLSGLNSSSRSIARFIMSHIGDETDKMYYLSSPQKQFSADGFLLDDFFAVYTKDSITLENRNGTSDCPVIRGNPEIKVRLVTAAANSYKLKLESDIIFLGIGQQAYILSDERLFVCDAGFTRTAAPLLELLSRRKSGVTVSHADMSSFYAAVIRPAAEYISVLSVIDTDQLVPMPLESKLYISLHDERSVSGELKFCYGKDVHVAFQPADISCSQDLRGEIRAQRLVKKYFTEIDELSGTAYIRNNERALFKLVNEGIPALSEQMAVYPSEEFTKLKVRPPVKLSIGVKINGDLLGIDINVEDYTIDELVEIIAAYRNGEEYYKMDDGSFVRLDDSSIDEISDMADTLDISEKEILAKDIILPRYRMLYLDSVLRHNKQIRFDRDRNFKRSIRDIKSIADSDYHTPESLRGIMRSYQVTGYRWMKTIAAYGFGGILADDMGLGKTLETIAFILSHKNDTGECSSIVICPSSLVLNWESEIHKWAPSLSVCVVMGTAPEREELIKNNSPDVFITSYDLLKRDIMCYDGKHFRFEFIDEAQYIKNHTTQNSRTVKIISADTRFALTGTPVENNLAELWSVFDYLMPGYLYNYNKFHDKFELPIVKENDEKALEGLKRLAMPFILRRLKKDVLKELPEKTETILYVPFEEEQRSLYDANALRMKAEIRKRLAENGEDNSRFEILAMLTKLRQICCAPSLALKKSRKIIPSAKLEMCMELLENCLASGHRVLLFSQFTSMLDIVAETLEERGLAYYRITGKTKSAERIHLVNSFNRDSTPVFLISLRAGGTGLNLTGADVVIHFDPWWNMSAQNQATDRAYRIGQLNKVQVYKLIAKDTIEEKILDLQNAKDRLAESVISESDGAIMRMKPSELLEIL